MYDFLKNEKYISDYWKEFKTFELSNDRRTEKNFVFYDGPPFATGLPHYGHLLVGTIKDVIARYKNMQGYHVPRRWGWDCHGVPVESLVQSKMNLSRVDAIQSNKVSQFNEECKNSVLTCANQWKNTVERMGRWVDFDRSYKTMDTDYMESVWWVFKQIYDQGRIYKAKRIMPYSCKLQTTLSNHEMGDYRNVEDPYVIAKFPVLGRKNLFLLAYTTTPWTLPSNSGLCVSPKEEYSYVYDEKDDATYLMASKLVLSVMKERNYLVKEVVLGESLLGMKYSSLYGRADYSVVTDDFVTVEDGTGIVHLAPAFGEDDYRVGLKYNLNFIDPLDAEGKFTTPNYKGYFCKDVDKFIVSDLNKTGYVFKYGKIKHDYPFCDRTNTPLIYRAVDAWYVKLEDIKDKLLKNNESINWVPSTIGSARFANWLISAKDWNVSRNRLWGSCLPLWLSEDGEVICVGSVAELESLAGYKINDLHKDTLDKVFFHKNGKKFTRVPEVLDCWFESGCMPYAQHHYPFENKDLVESNFPADFIVEGLDQTRGWFYTLLVISTLLFDKAPFKNVVVNGLVLSEDGTKMSKSKGNFTDPSVILDKYGADALRSYFCFSSAMYAEPLCFKEKDLQSTSRALLAPLSNSIDFYTLYSSLDNWSPVGKNCSSFKRELNRWIILECNTLIKESIQLMDNYDISKVLPKVALFLDKLCNWYIRLSRKLFWENGISSVKEESYYTLHHVLLNVLKVMAPFTPFATEQFYCTLGYRGSIHWENYPLPFEMNEDDLSFMKKMNLVQQLASMGHNLRIKHNIKVKQPLKKMLVSGINLSKNDKLLLSEELNVKEVIVDNSTQKMTLSFKPNFKVLGKKFGKEVQKIAAEIVKLSASNFKELQDHFNKNYGISIVEDDLICTSVLSTVYPTEKNGELSVSLDIEITPDLLEEGDVRELCSFIQGLRKSAKLPLNAQIAIYWVADSPSCLEFVRKHSEEIKKQVQAAYIIYDEHMPQKDFVTLKFGKLFISIMQCIIYDSN